jgi:hypothetical protein
MTETHIGIAHQVTAALNEQPIIDMHTHLYPPSFGTPMEGKSGSADPQGQLLWGIDELLTYHYLIAEVYRIVPAEKLPYEQFWKMSKRQQADHIFKHLFLERAPISEACRGVLTAVQKLGLDPADSLTQWRKYFDEQTPDKYIDRVMELSNVKSITMTNAVFDDNERNRWLANPKVGTDPRFTAVLRIDPLLRNWPLAASHLSQWGYPADAEINASSIESAKKFLRDWLDRMKAIYMAISLPPEWRYPSQNASQTVLEKIILPVSAELNIPFAMMIGSTLRVNPALREAGDMCGKADITSVVNLLREFPKNKFFVTMLSRENQHELAVAARKYGNLMIFGCWWFLNNPSLIEEITRMRIELLGTSFIPQHSDARVLDQLLYKWDHSKQVIGKVLIDKFEEMASAGRMPTQDQIRHTVDLFFAKNFREFLAR